MWLYTVHSGTSIFWYHWQSIGDLLVACFTGKACCLSLWAPEIHVICAGKAADYAFQSRRSLRRKRAWKELHLPVTQRVSKSAMRIGYQEDATYIRSKYHDNKGSFVRSQVSSEHLHNIAG